MKKLFYSLLAVVLAACGSEKQAPIDREALVARNNPQVSSFDSLHRCRSATVSLPLQWMLPVFRLFP